MKFSAIEIPEQVLPTPTPWNINIPLYWVFGDNKFFRNIWWGANSKNSELHLSSILPVSFGIICLLNSSFANNLFDILFSYISG